MKKKSLIITLTILILQSCTGGVSGTWKNDNIDREKREEIKIQNDILFKAITGNDNATIKGLMSEKFLEMAAGQDMEALISNVSASLKTGSYRILDQYYVSIEGTGLDHVIPAEPGGYEIKYKTLNKETYVSLLLPEGLDNELLIFVIYGKYENAWKLNVLQFGQYSLFGKNAPERYKLAKEKREKGYLADEVNEMSLVSICLKPAAEYLKYEQEDEIKAFKDRAMKEAEATYHFPITLENISSRPKIFKIYPEMIDEGFFPMVCYLTDINLDDTTALKAENERVKIETGKLFKGIDQDKKYVFYNAFSEMPDGKGEAEHYGFVDQRVK